MRKMQLAIGTAIVCLGLLGACQKKPSTVITDPVVNPEDTTNNGNGNGNGNGGNGNGNGNGSTDSLYADFTLRFYTDGNKSAASNGYIGDMRVTAENNSKGKIVSYKWYGRTGYYSSKPSGVISETQNLDHTFSLANSYDSTFIDVILEVEDVDGNTATMRKTLAFKNHKATGYIQIGNDVYQLDEDIFSNKFAGLTYYNRLDPIKGNDCRIYISALNFDTFGPLDGLTIEILAGGPQPIITVPDVGCKISFNGYTNDSKELSTHVDTETSTLLRDRDDVIGGIEISTTLTNGTDTKVFKLSVSDLPHFNLKNPGKKSTDCVF